jgi:hypothetical protein
MTRRKAGKKSKRMHMPTGHKPVTRDPTLEEIWGTENAMGLAEQIRLERPDHPEYRNTYRPPVIRECSTKMLPGGKGVLRGQG